jgi:hypothetical protein
MHRILTFLLALSLLVPAATAFAEEAGTVGYVKTSTGSTTVLRDSGEATLIVGSALFAGDVLVTGEEASLGFVFKDGTAMTAGPDTMLAIDDFAYAPAKKEYGLTARVSQGTVDFVSGLLGKEAPETVALTTPSGVIGIRGTHFAIDVKPSRDPAAWLAKTAPVQEN